MGRSDMPPNPFDSLCNVIVTDAFCVVIASCTIRMYDCVSVYKCLCDTKVVRARNIMGHDE